MTMKKEFLWYHPKQKEYARWHRNNSTFSEILFWIQVRNKQIRGYDFHRQKPVDYFILDFFCPRLMLGIELDGITHHEDAVIAKDKIKEERMKSLGISMLRFPDVQVYNHMPDVLSEIHLFIDDFENH
jgi:very-short-patch-repair endonuclease